MIRDEEREATRARTDKLRSRIHFALLGALLTLVVGCAVVLFQMWVEGHKVVSVEKLPTASSSHLPQDATDSQQYNVNR
jgi:hypothetical protein